MLLDEFSMASSLVTATRVSVETMSPTLMLTFIMYEVECTHPGTLNAFYDNGWRRLESRIECLANSVRYAIQFHAERYTIGREVHKEGREILEKLLQASSKKIKKKKREFA